MSIDFEILSKADDFKSSAFSFCRKLDLDFFPQPWTSNDWTTLFTTDQERFLLVAKDESGPVGFVLFNLASADSFAHLLKIIVDPSKRGHHYGEQLLTECLRLLSHRDIRHFYLEVEEGNLPAIRLYEKSGFQKIHFKKNFYSNGSNALVMLFDQ